MKSVLFVLKQLGLFVLFYVVFLAGSLMDPFHMKWFIKHPTPTSTTFFVPDGLILATALYLIILAIEAARKKLRTSGLWTTVVFVLVLGVIFGFTQIGLVSKELF